MTVQRALFAVAGVVVLAVVFSMGVYAQEYGRQPRHDSGIPVSVVNTVDVRDADNPAFEPVQFRLANINATDQRFVTVPAGVRLVIEFVSVQGQAASGCLPVSVQVSTTVRGTSAAHSFAVDNVVPLLSGNNSYTVNESTRIYADPGTQVGYGTTGAPQVEAGECSMAESMTVSGYLVHIEG